MSELFIGVLYFAFGWLILPSIMLFSDASTAFRKSLGLTHRSGVQKVLSQIVELVTFFSLCLVIYPLFGTSLNEVVGRFFDELTSDGFGSNYIVLGLLTCLICWLIGKKFGR